MRTIRTIVVALLSLNAIIFSEVSQNPLSAGTTQTRNTLGRSVEAATSNPAILGVERAPKAGILFPGSNVGIGTWSDKLKISPFTRFWVDSLHEASSLTSNILKRSFDLDGLTPDEVTDKLMKEFKDGFRVYEGARATLFGFAKDRIAFDVTTHFDGEIQIPEGVPQIIFRGFRRGDVLDFSDFHQEAVWATDFTFNIGLPVNIPALHNLFKLRYGAGGLGVKYVMGHSIMKADAESGTLSYDSISNQVSIDASLKLETAGFGFDGPWSATNLFKKYGMPVTGHGLGVDIGGILYDNHGTMSINVSNLGAIYWVKDYRQGTVKIKKNSTDVYDILMGIDEADKNNGNRELVIFNRAENDYLSDESDSLQDGSGFFSFLPLTLNIGYGYTFDFSKEANQKIRLLSEYLSLSGNYQQQIIMGPGRSPFPRLSFGAETGAFKGVIPLRVGTVLGGPERVASALGIGINLNRITINGSYKAIGSPFFVPKKGMELAVGFNLNWGMTIDTDKDGIPDKDDACPEIPEDIDGFEDKDGCPDYDNDKDGILDSLDKCPVIAEDTDGFEDQDGCPDYDNDLDNITDSLDKCPNDPEDKDNFNDQDGCPEFDNDNDGVKDNVDKCPNIAEDIDMFEDEDGCPEFDNDRDGIPDTTDNCMNIPESFNSYKDEDGCPDTLLRPSASETKTLNTKLRAINFKSGNAELLSVSFAALDYIADFLRQFPHLRYEIQGHTDSQGSDEYNLVLSAARAGTVRGYLVVKGINDSSLIAIGYGESSPVADNSTSLGRATNRRVDFKIIESTQEYSDLKMKETVTRDIVRAAKIKGSQY